MTTPFSRRRLLGTALTLPMGLGPALSAVASSGQVAPRAIKRRDETAKVSLALLPTHWDAIQEVVEAYAEARGIEIEAHPLAYDALYSQLSLSLTQQATTYDVVSLVDPWVPQFGSFLSPLDIPDDLLEAFVPVAATLGRYPEDAQPCALPWLGETQFFAARQEWMERLGWPAPATWDETVESSKAISASLDVDSDSYAFAMSTHSQHDLVESFLPILLGYGKSIIDPKTSVPQLDTPEAIAAMETFLSLSSLGPPESEATGDPSNAERFDAGQVTMMSNYWSSDLLAARKVEMTNAVGGIAGAQQPAQSNIPRQTMTGVWLLGIPVGSLFPDEGRAFIQWLTGTDAQLLFPALALPPSRQDVYGDPKLLDTFPELDMLLSVFESATPRARSPFYPQLEQLLATELANAVNGKKSGNNALKDANVAIREYLVREGVLTA